MERDEGHASQGRRTRIAERRVCTTAQVVRDEGHASRMGTKDMHRGRTKDTHRGATRMHVRSRRDARLVVP